MEHLSFPTRLPPPPIKNVPPSSSCRVRIHVLSPRCREVVISWSPWPRAPHVPTSWCLVVALLPVVVLDRTALLLRAIALLLLLVGVVRALWLPRVTVQTRITVLPAVGIQITHRHVLGGLVGAPVFLTAAQIRSPALIMEALERLRVRFALVVATNNPDPSALVPLTADELRPTLAQMQVIYNAIHDFWEYRDDP